MGDVAYDGWLIVVGYGFILEVVSRVIDMVVLWMESLVSVVRVTDFELVILRN